MRVLKREIALLTVPFGRIRQKAAPYCIVAEKI